MVMVTRSAYKRSCEMVFNSLNDKRDVPPWCSGKALGKGKFHDSSEGKFSKRTRYAATGESIWKIPCKNNSGQNSSHSKRGPQSCKRNKHRGGMFYRPTLLWITFALFFMGSLTLYQRNTTRQDFLSLLAGDEMSVPIEGECCYRMKQLFAALVQLEQRLRKSRRRQQAFMLTGQTATGGEIALSLNADLIEGVTVSKGRGTQEWVGRAALWGVVPVWRSPPPPQTVVSTRKTNPGDCWPFSGSRGELVLDLPNKTKVRRISIEHIRPDAARSAPRHFALYGILENGTWIKDIRGVFTTEGSAKQFFYLKNENILKRLVFRVLSNHGNTKYTCLYRLHVYRKL